MKTVFNWTVGSFFRSIGRIVAYVFIGGLIAYLLNRSGFDWGRLLGIETVKADSYQTFNVYGTYGNNVSNCSGYGSPTNCSAIPVENGFYQYHGFFDYNSNTYTYTTFKQFLFYFNSNGSIQTAPNGATSVQIPFRLYFPNGITTYYMTSDLTTTQSFTQSQEENVGFVVETFNSHLTIGVCNLTSQAGDIYYLTCPITDDIQFVRIRLYYNPVNYGAIQNASIPFRVGYKDAWAWVIDSGSQINNSINQQTQQQQQQYNDTNSTSESNTATSYFNSQQDDTPSALTSAITSPLRIIDNAIQGTHNPLCFTLNSKQSCIPSGDLIWGGNTGSNNYHHWFDSGYFNPKQTFINFFNIVVAGYLCYKMLLSMMRIFNDSIDPTVSKIEVMKL